MRSGQPPVDEPGVAHAPWLRTGSALLLGLEHGRQELPVERRGDVVAGVEVQAHVQAGAVEDDLGAGLARDQLAAGRVDGAAGAAGEHAVEPPAGHVAEGDRDRADGADPVGLALQGLEQRARVRSGLADSMPDHLEAEAGPLGAQLLGRRGSPPRRGGEVLLGRRRSRTRSRTRRRPSSGRRRPRC